MKRKEKSMFDKKITIKTMLIMLKQQLLCLIGIHTYGEREILPPIREINDNLIYNYRVICKCCGKKKKTREVKARLK